MKKLLRSAALLFGLLGSAQAATSVTTEYLHLRRVPAGEILRVIPKGTLLTVACTDSGWCRTSYRGRGGYVAARYLRPLTRSVPVGGADFYASCAQMRAAGVAPIRVGRPGYRTVLDTDHDGWACRYDQVR